MAIVQHQVNRDQVVNTALGLTHIALI